MNKFQREVKKRRKNLLTWVGKGNVSDRVITIWIKQTLQEQLKSDRFILK